MENNENFGLKNHSKVPSSEISGNKGANAFNRENLERGGQFVRIYAESVKADHHQVNEDSFLVLQGKAAGVFDGVGGHEAGDKASRIARDHISKLIPSLEGLTFEEAQERMRQILIDADRAVYYQARAERNNMGTTASLVYLWEGAQGDRKAIIGNVGDSRVYLLRDGVLRQVTLDDSNFANLPEEEARRIQNKLSNVVDPQKELKPEEFDFFSKRNAITQCLGRGQVEPRVYAFDFQKGDNIIVLSDGVSDNLTDKEIEEILNSASNREDIANKLVDASRERSRSGHVRRKPDDMTAVVIEVQKGASIESLELKTPKKLLSEEPEEAQRKQPEKDIERETESRAESKFKTGDSVRVQRSNGEIEDGWVIKGFEEETGRFIVEKYEGNSILRKKITPESLERLNMEVSIEDIQNAKNLDELKDILQRIGGIQGSKYSYTSEELIGIIDRVVAGEESIRKITRSGGLRKKVAGLIIERLKVQIEDLERAF